MIDTKLEQGIKLWQELAESLNSIIEETGKIEINNDIIWKEFLHSWNNEEWILALIAIETLFESHPQFFKGNHEDAFITAKEILIKNNNSVERIMDRKNKKVSNKKHAWKMIMTMREVWNNANGIYLPNEDASKKKSVFPNLFEM